MIPLHQTVSIGHYLNLVRGTHGANALADALRRLFPHHATTLTDSGRSALGLAIETLKLQGKTVAVPAYVCDVLLPVFDHYKVRPVFLDIDADTFQPPITAYTDDVLDRIDGALLVATYGGPIDPAIPALLTARGKTVIEDFAHCPLPSESDEICGDARYYSFPKLYPVTDGGVAVFADAAPATALKPHRMTVTTTINFLKRFRVSNAFYMTAKHLLGPRSSSTASLSWNGARKPSASTRRIMSSILLKNGGRDWRPTPWQYCLPIRVRDPKQALQALYRHGIAAERLWSDPIIAHPRAASLWGVSKQTFPETTRAAQEIVCAPLWHIKSEQAFRTYRNELERILTGNLTE